MDNDKPKRIANRHFIGVVREIDGYLVYEKDDIPQEDILIGEIEAMKENDKRTLLDVQSLFTEFYPEENFKGKHYDYLFPKKYNDAYVSGASYPHILTVEEYENKLEEQEKWYRSEEYITGCCKEKDELKYLKKNATEEEYNSKINELVKEKMKDYVNSLRRGFSYQNFIYAQRYTAKLREIKKESNVKMYSTDQIGWKDFEYKVNEDITAYIKTNFGYGVASYFFCNLKYKDINILPYSWPVKYFYVEMVDFVRYTRRYLPRRTSWSEVFDFTVTTANMAKHEPERFIKEWIVNEVEEMMKGLRLYMSSPDAELAEFLNAKRKASIYDIHEVAEYAFKDVIRNCGNRDREEYKAMPKEKVIAFKAEKITGSLLLLDNLKKLSEIASVIIPYIAEIEEMNLKLQPEIELHLKNISEDINKLNIKLDSVIKELEPLTTKLQYHKNKIDDLLEKTNKGRENKDKISKYEAEKTYEKKHPEYTVLKNRIEKLTEQKDALEKEITRRENFVKILTKCKKRIAKYIIAA
jgi:hypothetical protein